MTGTPILRQTERHEMPNLQELGLLESQPVIVKNNSRPVSRLPFQLPPLPPLPSDLFGDYATSHAKPRVNLTNPNSLLLLPSSTSSQSITGGTNSLLSRPLSLSPFTRLPNSFYAPINPTITRPT